MAGVVTDAADIRDERIRLVSGTGAEVSGSRTFTELLSSAVEQILLRPIRWGDILQYLQTWIKKADPKAFNVVPVGTAADQLIHTVLKQTPLRSLVSPHRRRQGESTP